jgi:hypothetical protein
MRNGYTLHKGKKKIIDTLTPNDNNKKMEEIIAENHKLTAENKKLSEENERLKRDKLK